MKDARTFAGRLVALFVIYLGYIDGANAQFCPAGSTQEQNGYVIECHCPDGSLAGISGCPQSVEQPPPSICPADYTYCATTNQCCGAGSYCSHYGCTPNSAIECGNHYCNPGQQCSRSGGCQPAGSVDCGPYYCQPGQKCGIGRRACLPLDAVDCGPNSNIACNPGSKCSRNGQRCLPQSSTECANGAVCDSGEKCSRDGSHCLTQEAIDCGAHSCSAGFKCGANKSCIANDSIDCGHGHSCDAGMKCGSAYQCLDRHAIDCGSGRSCPAGTVCVGAADCLTPAQIADRRAAEQNAKAEQAALEKQRLAEEATRAKLQADAQALELQWNRQRSTKQSKRKDSGCDNANIIVENIIGGVPDPRPMCAANEQPKSSNVAASGSGLANSKDNNTITTIIPGRQSQSPVKDTTQAGPLLSGEPKENPQSGPLGTAAPVVTTAPIGTATTIATPTNIGKASGAKQSQSSGQLHQSGLTLNPDLKDVATLSAGSPIQASTTVTSQQTTLASGPTFAKSTPSAPQGPASLWGRLENAVSFANAAAKSDPNFQQGKKQLEATAAAASVGCAVGAVLGGGAGATVGGLPAVPGAIGGCAAGAAAGEATLGAFQTAYSTAQGISALLKNQTTPLSVRAAVTNVVSDVADKGSDQIPVTATLQVGGSWSTYFAYAFYTNPPGN